MLKLPREIQHLKTVQKHNLAPLSPKLVWGRGAGREGAFTSWLAFVLIAVLLGTLLSTSAQADLPLLRKHCGKCHNDTELEGDFSLGTLGSEPTEKNLNLWLHSQERIQSGEMPPPEESKLSEAERTKITSFLKLQLDNFSNQHRTKTKIRPRRMNNREFANSVAAALLIEDVGTHLPTDNLIGDARYHGFDTHGETLGFSKFHLEQYIKSVRAIVNAPILSGSQPKSKRYDISPEQIFAATTSQNTRRPARPGTIDGFDFLDPKSLAYLGGFEITPTTGRYRIKIRCTALDRGTYDEEDTGIYDADPIQLRVIMGDRLQTFDLPDNEITELELDEWLAAETRFRLTYPTDGLRLLANGNFKFQNRITAKYFKTHKPERYRELVATFPTKRGNGRIRKPDDWHNWVDYWQGPRPRIVGATVEGPLFKVWPPERQVALIGREPSAENAEAILRPLAERAWRRKVRVGELDKIVAMVKSQSSKLGDIEALKEGIIALLVSPEFLLLNGEGETCLLYTSPSPRDLSTSRMPSSA